MNIFLISETDFSFLMVFLELGLKNALFVECLLTPLPPVSTVNISELNSSSPPLLLVGDTILVVVVILDAGLDTRMLTIFMSVLIFDFLLVIPPLLS